MTAKIGLMLVAIQYKWSTAEVLAPVVHLACELTPEVKSKIKTPEITLENMRKMDCLGIFQDEAPIGAFLFSGREFHAAILPEYRGKWMNREFIKIMLEEKKKRGSLFTVLTEASPLVQLSVLHFCNRYGIEVRHD